MTKPLPWSAQQRNPSTETIAEAIRETGLIWPNNEATTSYVVTANDKGWRLTILYCGKDDWHRPVHNLTDLLREMREIAPVWQWERWEPAGTWPPRIYLEVE